MHAVDTTHPLPAYPRPQLVRENNWVNLNGMWDIQLDAKFAVRVHYSTLFTHVASHWLQLLLTASGSFQASMPLIPNVVPGSTLDLFSKGVGALPHRVVLEWSLEHIHDHVVFDLIRYPQPRWHSPPALWCG
jgi:hypothetical protein